MELRKGEEMITNQTGALINPYIVPKEIGSFSMVQVTVTSTGHGMTKSTLSDRIIKVISGEGEMRTLTSKRAITPGFVCVIPKNTYYDYSSVGSYELVVEVTDIPKFNPDFEVSYTE